MKPILTVGHSKIEIALVPNEVYTNSKRMKTKTSGKSSKKHAVGLFSIGMDLISPVPLNNPNGISSDKV